MPGRRGGAAWLAVNVPVMILTYEGWKYFYKFNEDRGADWGSIWLFLVRPDPAIVFSALPDQRLVFAAAARVSLRRHRRC